MKQILLMDTQSAMFFFVITIILTIAFLFLILRAFILWYFRINHAITLLESISAKLGPDKEKAPIPSPETEADNSEESVN